VTRFTVEVLTEAEREFREAFLWYFERSPIAADAFRSQVLEAIDRLAERADIWPANDDGFHFYVLDRFPYTIWYEVNKQLATVIAIAHQHRRPNYWKTRS
jgi:plasmid stabilization system protein ParE